MAASRSYPTLVPPLRSSARSGSRLRTTLAAGRSLSRCVLAITLALSAWTTFAAAQTLDSKLWVTNGTVYSIARSGNTIYVGGLFSWVGPPTGGGALVSTVTGGLAGPILSIVGSVNTVLADGSGGFYLGGGFSSVGGQPRMSLAHIDASGAVTPWTADVYSPSGYGDISAMAKIGNTVFVGGTFDNINGQMRGYLAALDATTGAVTDWTADADSDVTSLVVRGNTLYAGGLFSHVGGQARAHVAALDATTGAVTDWTADVNGNVYALATSADTIFVGGAYASIGEQLRNRLAAVSATTGAVAAWDPNADNTVLSLAVSGGTVYAGGSFSTIGGQAHTRLAAIDAATGAVSSTWSPAADGSVNCIVAAGNTVYVGGSFSQVGGVSHPGVAAIDGTTGIVSAWDPHPAASWVNIRALAVNGSTIFVGGTMETICGRARSNLAAFDVATGAATEWNPGANAQVNAVIVSDGKVYVGGQFTQIGGLGRNWIGSIDSFGIVTDWNPNAGMTVRALAASGNSIYVGGQFTQMGGQPRNRLAAVDATTGAVTAWNPNASASVYTLAVAGNTIYVGGSFHSVGLQTRNYIASVDATTGAVNAWDPNPTDYVESIVPAGPLVYVGGYFVYIGGQERPGVAAIGAVTGVPTDWTPGDISEGLCWVRALALSGNVMYVGGMFASMGQRWRCSLAAVDIDTGIATDWSPITMDVGILVYALSCGGGELYAGGNFRDAGGMPRSCLAGFTEELAAAVPPVSHASGFALAGLRPNPAVRDLSVAFTLPDASPAKIEVLDIAGRIVLAREVGTLGAGSHTLNLGAGRSFPPGVYLLRLTQGGRTLTARGAVIR